MTKVTLAVPLSLAILLAACPPSNKSPNTCTGGSTACNGGCVALETDPANCGSCGTQCGPGQSCSSGACACPSGEKVCGALCSTVSTDALNCGACGNACQSGELCQGGACVCETNRSPCGKRCVDLTSDVDNCGACGTACDQDAGQVCSASSCSAYCEGVDSGVTDCGGSCVDTQTDPTNCGACGQGCIPGGLCANGGCTCAQGQTACDAGCFDLTSTQQNCGACGNACASYQLCGNSQCTGPDLYVSCSDDDFATTTSNGIVGIDSLTGAVLLPIQTVSGPAPDGGKVVQAQIASTLFTDPQTLWVLDTTNSQVDVLDVSVWPATVKGTVAVGSYPEQLILCGGLVIVTNSGDNTVQGINPTSMATVAEVNLGAGESPELMACDGVHTVYVTDWSGGDIKSIDVSQKSWAVGHTLAIPAADTASLPDGGLAAPSPFGMAFAATGGGSEVLVSLENLDLANGYAPAGPATVLVIDSQLSGVQSTINPGAACQNGQFLSLSPSGATLIETCTGAFYTGSTTGTLAPIALPGGTVGPLASVPLGNPGPTTYLKNGLVAVGDQASGQLAIWNPADGGVLVLDPCTSPLPDGGNVTSEIVGAVVAAP